MMYTSINLFVCLSVCVCVCACVRACVRACVCMCVRVWRVGCVYVRALACMWGGYNVECFMRALHAYDITT